MRNLFIAVLLVLFVNTSIASIYNVPSESMEDTLLTGDVFVLMNFWYGIRLPWVEKPIIPVFKLKGGDIIVFRSPLNKYEEMVKRCVAVGGESIDIIQKHVYVGGRPVPLPAQAKNTDTRLIPAGDDAGGRRDFYPRTVVPDSAVFVLGDNRDVSQDSRLWGLVPVNSIKGKVGIVLFSLDPKVKWLDIPHKFRWKRVFHAVK